MSHRILLLGRRAPERERRARSSPTSTTSSTSPRATRSREQGHGDRVRDAPIVHGGGELVPDPVVNEIVKAALADADGFVLDGYPRNLDQAEYLSEITDLDAVIFLDVDEEVLVDRLTGRRVCDDCGANFHVDFQPPEEGGVCDECGGELIQRDDDTEETARERLEVFYENTEPVIDHFRDEGDLVEVDGEATPDEVFERIRDVLDE